MKEIKHIRRDVHSVARVMTQGWDLGVPWGVGGPKTCFPKFNQIWCVSYLHEWHIQRHNFLVPTSWGLREGPKGQISLNLNYKVNFKDFFLSHVCFLTNERYKTYMTGFSFCSLDYACPRVWDRGVLGGQKFNFMNIVMWHIKLKGMSSRPGYTENFYPWIKLVTLGCGQRIEYH